MATQPSSFEHREFPMTDANFIALQQKAYECTGIRLTDHKKEMVYGRIARRCRNLGLRDFDQYCDLIDQDDHDEHDAFINIITTNLTSFYRESHHFEFLRNTIVPWMMEKHRIDRRIRIWSAGCSSGEEPYTIAAVLAGIPSLKGWDIKILATDLDSDTLDKGKKGLYAGDKLENLSKEQYESLFERGSDRSLLSIKPELRYYIEFKRLNLMEYPWTMKGKFDLIFCRNVVIYFDKETQKTLFDRYADQMAADSYLIIGHSESLNGVSDRFSLCGKTLYRRVC